MELNYTAIATATVVQFMIGSMVYGVLWKIVGKDSWVCDIVI